MTCKSGLLAVFLLVISAAGFARADEPCRAPPEAGEWAHPRPDTNMLSSLEIEHFCTPDQRFGDWKIRAKSRCFPRDCTWGWSPAQRHGRDDLYAGFQGFYSTRFLLMRTYGDRMEVDVKIVYGDEKRPEKNYTVILHRK